MMQAIKKAMSTIRGVSHKNGEPSAKVMQERPGDVRKENATSSMPPSENRLALDGAVSLQREAPPPPQIGRYGILRFLAAIRPTQAATGRPATA